MTLNFEEQVPAAQGRYSRHALIKWWSQERLRNSCVMVVGAGAVGNEVLKTLALLGLGKLIVVDFDMVEESNLSRTVLFSSANVGQPKAVAAAESVTRLNSDVECRAINGDLELDVGVGTVSECDMVLGCVDSVNARWAINRTCYRAGVPWINAGINERAAEVSVYSPEEGPCYECGMTEAMWKRFNERRSCMLLLRAMPPQTVPTTAIVASLAASLQVNEAVRMLHNHENRLRPGQKAFFNTDPYAFFVVDLPQNAECPAHEQYVPGVIFNGSPNTTTLDALLSAVPESTSLQLDFDLLAGFQCKNCGLETACVPVKRVTVSQLKCDGCGELRRPLVISEVTADNVFSSRSLHDLGIPSRAILRVNTRIGGTFVELSQ